MEYLILLLKIWNMIKMKARKKFNFQQEQFIKCSRNIRYYKMFLCIKLKSLYKTWRKSTNA